MLKTLFILSCLLVAAICAAQPVEKLLKEADSLSYEKKYTEALQVYNRAWLIDSSNFRLYIDRGRAYEGVKDLEKAFYDYSKAIQLQPDSAEGYHYRAIILYSMMYTEESIMDNTLALERASNDTIRMMSFMNRGNGKMQKRDFQGAYEDFTRASFYNPNEIGILNNIATVLDELNRVDEAIDYLKRAIKIDSTFIGPYVNLGFQYTKLKRYREAIEYFNKALLIDKDEPLTLNNRGLARFYINDLDGALADINRSLSIYPDNSYAYKNRAVVYLAQKNKEKACADLNKAIELEFTKVYGGEVNELIKANCK